MKTLFAILTLVLLSGCGGPGWSSFETKHPPPSLFQTTLPWEGYRAPLPPI